MRWLAVALLSVTMARAEAGPSFLGLCSATWNCAETARFYSKQDRLVAGWLEGAFGKECPCADKLLATDKKKVIRVHLMNSPCMRNGRCGRYEPLYGYNKASASRAVMVEGSRLNKRFNAVLERFKRRLGGARGEVACFVSPCLECDLDERSRNSLLSRVSVALPECAVVDSPYRQKCIEGIPCERHGAAPKLSKPCIADLDGEDGKVVDLAAYKRHTNKCAVKYYWEPWMNCVRGDRFIDPRKRDCFYARSQFESIKGKLWQLS